MNIPSRKNANKRLQKPLMILFSGWGVMLPLTSLKVLSVSDISNISFGILKPSKNPQFSHHHFNRKIRQRKTFSTPFFAFIPLSLLSCVFGLCGLFPFYFLLSSAASGSIKPVSRSGSSILPFYFCLFTFFRGLRQQHATINNQ